MRDTRAPVRRLSPPPRSLPATLSVRLLFGGLLGQLGWLFVAFGMLFVWIFDGGGGLAEWLRFRGAVATAEGTTTGWRQTSLSINETPVYETSYVFPLADGRSVSGVSYETGSWMEEGLPVTIEYVDGDPPLSRIQGMRASRGGLGVAFTFVFPLVGLVIGLAGLRKGVRARRLLTIGEVTRGELQSTEKTNTVVNNRPVMRLTFAFEAVRGGTYQVEAKTHEPERLEDEQRELLVYDPRRPERAVMLDEMPCQPRIDERGELMVGRPGLPTALYLLLPGISAVTLMRYLASLG